MNFSPAIKSWLLLGTLVISAGGAVTMAAHEGGASLGWSIGAGLISGCSSVYHALCQPPTQNQNQKIQ